MDGLKLVALNLRRIRVARGFSQEALAVDAQIDRTYVGGIERGTANPTVALLDRLAEALEVHVREFFEEAPTAGSAARSLTPGRKPSTRHRRRSPLHPGERI
ncbi:MAG: helix-turn-helix transcriptional regulator [Bauldia sp.]|nr:helix-turn-helix transcriptional regulator [Bauldia sp.]